MVNNVSASIEDHRMSDDVKLNWRLAELNGSALKSRDGHCACGHKNLLYIFGGLLNKENNNNNNNKGDFTNDNDNPSYESNEMVVFNLDHPISSRIINSTGDVPCARSCATMACVDGKIYLFGGSNRDLGWLDQPYIFDTETEMWKKLETANSGPSPRDKLTSVVKGKLIYLFGGFGPIDKQQVDRMMKNLLENSDSEDDGDGDDEFEAASFAWFNDLYILNTENNTWCLESESSDYTVASAPSPRAAHSMNFLDEDLFAVFGGRDKMGRCNDFYIYSTDRKEWQKKSDVKGLCPEARSFHAAVSIDSKLVIVGGRSNDDKHFNDFHIYNLDTNRWFQPEIQTNISCRGLHTMTLAADGKKIALFAGSSNLQPQTNCCTTFYSDLYIMSTERLMDKSIAS